MLWNFTVFLHLCFPTLIFFFWSFHFPVEILWVYSYRMLLLLLLPSTFKQLYVTISISCGTNMQSGREELSHNEYKLVIPGCCQVLSPTRKETSYSDQTLTFASQSKKKNSEGCLSNQVSAAAMTSASDEKWRPFNCFFISVGLRTYQHPCTDNKQTDSFF